MKIQSFYFRDEWIHKFNTSRDSSYILRLQCLLNFIIFLIKEMIHL